MEKTIFTPTPPIISKVLTSIGQPRLDPYKVFFRCLQDDNALLGAYLWGQTITAALHPCLSFYEVVLRNMVHRAASKFASPGNTNESFPWYEYHEKWALTLRGKTREKVTEVLYDNAGMLRAPMPSPDSVVASLSFGFWPGFLEGLSMRERPRIFTDTFAHHPHSKPRHWSDATHVTDVIARLKKIQSLRNAVAHLEPIWKSHRLKGTETHWSHSVASLRNTFSEMLTVIQWCCPETAKLVEQSYAKRLFTSVCSTDAVHAFMQDPLGAGSMPSFKQPAIVAPLIGKGVIDNLTV